MTADDGQGSLDVTLEEELAAATEGEQPTDAEGTAALAASGRQARARKTKARAAAAKQAATDPTLDELRDELAEVRVATAGVPAEIMSYSRSPGMELNSTAARALDAVGGHGDLLVIAVEPGHLADITRLAHVAFRIAPAEQ